ncbi:MAG: DUF4914 family protein [Candidatus Omnitrophica bacterium]|nr:DUF4914 family protein [Candidatus Omnitrophota bacterium]
MISSEIEGHVEQLDSLWEKLDLPVEIRTVLQKAPKVSFADSLETLREMALPFDKGEFHEVAYEVEGRGRVVEALACHVKNGIAVNYTDPYMRRRDPDCLLIGDEEATDKEFFRDRMGYPFEDLREATLEWLSKQELAVFVFHAGTESKGMPGMAICPANAGFFALGLAMLQGVLRMDQIQDGLSLSAFIMVAPPFRHTHFEGKQVVVHDRTKNYHALYSYNLYPGPSAKKGVYGMLLNLGEKEGWLTAHCSTVMVVTPYDNHVVIMHEGASGGGKSEMLEQIHREPDGRLLLGQNMVTGERRHLILPRGCDLHPVTDDMALCHSIKSKREKKIRVSDAETSWFVRVNHIPEYGTDPHLEAMTVKPKSPIMFLNIDAVPGSTALIWEHTEDSPGQPCPNPRVILPRESVPGIVDGKVTVDIRSFGVRTPPCTKESPSYGILGIFHILPAPLAWLWRLTAPRGHANPSIVSTGTGIPSEGVGSYWPFATGQRVDHANLLLDQILSARDTLYALIPNQHIGAWQVGFMPQWVCREYLARRGATRFRDEQLMPARCSLLGYSLRNIQVEGNSINQWLLQVESQPEVGHEAYDQGAQQLFDFFKGELEQHLVPKLHPKGREIIECCLSGGVLDDYQRLAEEW